MREGYYSIINGYKEPFLEPVVTKDDLSDRYKGGTSFDDIFALFTFDRSLRALTFGNIQHFFNLMKPNEKASVCKMIAESTGRKGSKLLGYFDVDEA